MKTFICSLLLPLLLFGAVNVNGDIISNMNYKATIHKGAYFTLQPYVILGTLSELENYVQQIMDDFKKDTAEVSPDYLTTLENQVRESYAQYNQSFFERNILAIILVEQGSGNVSYQLESLFTDNDVLTVNVKKNAPMIQTMDFVSWVMFLELDKDDFSQISSIKRVLI